MHSGDRLEHEGPVCKCMECAHKRQERRKREGTLITKRQSFVADIAGVEGDLGRTRLEFADDGDLLTAAMQLEKEAERLLSIAGSMAVISREALKKVLDGE